MTCTIDVQRNALLHRKRLVRIPIGPSIAYVELTKGQWALIEVDDALSIGEHNWAAAWNNKTQSFYARRSTRARNRRCISIGMHSEILGLPSGSVPDHTNRNTLDNRRHGNLRSASPSQNNWNASMRSTNTSGYKGVSWNKMRGKWQAQIHKGNKNFHLGYFSTPETAHEAFSHAATQLHGEFARVA